MEVSDFDPEMYKDALCVMPGDGAIMFGEVFSLDISNLEISFQKCDTSKPENDCWDETEVAEYFASHPFGLVSQQVMVDYKDDEVPIKRQ